MDELNVTGFRPRTEVGHLYCKLMQRLLVGRELGVGQHEQAVVCDQMDDLWPRMSADEQARVESVLAPHVRRR